MRKLNTTILIGLLVAALGFVLTFAYLDDYEDRVADGRATVDVLVASERLTSGATPGDLEGKVAVKAVPSEYVADDAISDLDDVAGLVLLGPVAKDGQLTKAQFGQARDAGAIAPSDGKVALAVGVDLTPGVARYITAGSTVDVFATYTAGSGTAAQGSGSDRDVAAKRTKLFVSNVKVLSVSVAEVPDDDADDNADSTTSTEASTVEVVAVLDVTPAQAEQIVNAQTLGELYLALNSVDGKGEDHKTPTGVTPEQVVTANK